MAPLAIASTVYFDAAIKLVTQDKDVEHECCVGKDLKQSKSESCKLKCSIAIVIAQHEQSTKTFVSVSQVLAVDSLQKHSPPIYESIRPPIV